MLASTYLAIAGGCALFYGVSMLSGGDHHDFHHDFGGHHGGDSHSSHHDGDNASVRAFFSLRSLLLFGLGFGSVGAVATSMGVSAVLIPIFGSLAGVVFAWIGIQVFLILRKQEGNTPNSLLELEGMSGRITTSIPASGVGEVLIRNQRGDAQYLRARSEDGSPIVADQNVEVVSAAAGDLVVRKAATLPRTF